MYGFLTISGSRRAYVAPGRSRKVWYVWTRLWGRPATFVRIPRELTLDTRYDDGYEAIKLVMDDYELGGNEMYLDTQEDAQDENYPDSDCWVRNDADDDNNSKRSEAETEYAAEALVYAQF